MESVDTICEGEWNTSFNGLCSEEAAFMAQLLGNCSLPNEVPSGPSIALSSSFWPAHESNLNFSSDESMFCFSLGSSSYSGGNSILFPSSNHESYYPFMSTNNLIATDYFVVDGKSNSSRVTNDVIEGDDFLNQDISNESIESDEKLSVDVLQRKNLQIGIEKETPILESVKEGKIRSHSEMSKKRPRVPGDFQRSKKLKKCAKVDDNDDDNNNSNTNMVLHRQSSTGCSEDDSHASHEMNGVTSSSSSKGKTRASRGSATDPQSIYARKRRERINERLRILQNLVPNGTKVDISTMLEEAVQYVKFLQLQIKLLSSDELWMYAPIAYNGMDIGLDFKIPTPKPQS